MTDKISETILSYYRQLDLNSITEEEYKLWLESLQGPMKEHFTFNSLERSKGVLNLQRFILELRDFSLEDYMREGLTEEEYKTYSAELL